MRTIVCPECSRGREVTSEHAARVGRGQYAAVCRECRDGRRVRVVVTEEHRLWWLRYAGVDTSSITGPNGAADYVRSHGMPDALRPIAASAAMWDR